MEFIYENYIWFLGGGIIFLMTLIGYIADKSNYIEKQKERDNKTKEQNEIKKKNHLTYGKKAFIKEIGKGNNLVLEEDLLTYPVEFDREPEEIIIPRQEQVSEEIDDLLNQELTDAEITEPPVVEEVNDPAIIEQVMDTPVVAPVTEETDKILAPQDIVETAKEEDIWNF